MKKLRIFAALLVLTLLLTPAAAAAEPETVALRLPSVTGEQGETIAVPVYLARNPGLAGFCFRVSCGEGLELVAAEPGKALAEAEGEFRCNPAERTVLWIGAEDVACHGGILMTLKLRVLDSTAGTARIFLELADQEPTNLVNKAGKTLGLEVTGGSVELLPPAFRWRRITRENLPNSVQLTVSVSCFLPDRPQDSWIAAAAYAGGRMLRCRLAAASLEEGRAEVTLNLPRGEEIRLFWLEAGSLRPLTEAKILS